jgi:hypothetical protein
MTKRNKAVSPATVKTANELLPVYRALQGGREAYECRTKNAIVAYILQRMQKGDSHGFISIDGCVTARSKQAHAVALCQALNKTNEVVAVRHGDNNVLVEKAGKQ